MKISTPQIEIHFRFLNRVRIFRSGQIHLTLENYWKFHAFKKLIHIRMTKIRGIILGPIGITHESNA